MLRTDPHVCRERPAEGATLHATTRELARDGRFVVTLADRDRDALDRSAKRQTRRSVEADLSQSSVVRALSGAAT